MRKYAENIIGGSIALIGLVIALSIAGCDEPTYEERHADSVYRDGTPPDATNIVILENRWYTFEWRGQCFLARKSIGSTTGTAQLARVDCE